MISDLLEKKEEWYFVVVLMREKRDQPPVRSISIAAEYLWFCRTHDAAIRKAEELARKYSALQVQYGLFTNSICTKPVELEYAEL